MPESAFREAVALISHLPAVSDQCAVTGQAIDNHLRQAAVLAKDAGAVQLTLAIGLARLETLRQFAMPQLEASISSMTALKG
jgi:hypothetical protein